MKQSQATPSINQVP